VLCARARALLLWLGHVCSRRGAAACLLQELNDLAGIVQHFCLQDGVKVVCNQ
jgi:hypothetical protein